MLVCVKYTSPSNLLSALFNNCIVIFLSFTMHICIMYGFPVPCAMTSSKDVVAYEDSAIGIPAFAAALDVASSPSLCARQCIALGLKPQGNAIFLPKISAVVSTLETFRSMRGRILYRSYAVTFSRSLSTSVNAYCCQQRVHSRHHIHGAAIVILSEAVGQVFRTIVLKITDGKYKRIERWRAIGHSLVRFVLVVCLVTARLLFEPNAGDEDQKASRTSRT